MGWNESVHKAGQISCVDLCLSVGRAIPASFVLYAERADAGGVPGTGNAIER